MDDAGSAHARFRRALLTKNMVLIDAAARELPQVGLSDALRILVVMAEKRDERYSRAAARWAERVAAERALDVGGVQRVWALLDELPGSPESSVMALRAFCS